MYMHGVTKGLIHKITPAGIVSTWLNGKDSVLNRATGKNELFENIEEGTAHTMAFDKDGNLFLMTNNSTYTILLKIFC